MSRLHLMTYTYEYFFLTIFLTNMWLTIYDRDPPWMTEKIKNKINLKRSLSKSNKFIEIQMLSTEISTLILERKYYHQPSKLGKMAGSKKLLSYMYYLMAVRQQKFQHVFFVVSLKVINKC